jgi:hypothetical protein
MYKVSGGRTIQDLVNRTDWQNLRESLVGHWMEEPEMCLRKIKNWLGNVSTAETDKLYIILNYLTGSAFRMKKINYTPANELKELIKLEIKKRSN